MPTQVGRTAQGFPLDEELQVIKDCQERENWFSPEMST